MGSDGGQRIAGPLFQTGGDGRLYEAMEATERGATFSGSGQFGISLRNIMKDPIYLIFCTGKTE